MSWKMNTITAIVDGLDDELRNLLPKMSLIKTEYSIIGMTKSLVRIDNDEIDQLSTLYFL